MRHASHCEFGGQNSPSGVRAAGNCTARAICLALASGTRTRRHCPGANQRALVGTLMVSRPWLRPSTAGCGSLGRGQRTTWCKQSGVFVCWGESSRPWPAHRQPLAFVSWCAPNNPQWLGSGGTLACLVNLRLPRDGLRFTIDFRADVGNLSWRSGHHQRGGSTLRNFVSRPLQGTRFACA